LSEAIREWIHRYADELNKTQNVDVLDKYIASNYIWHLPGKNILGLENLKKEFANSMPYQLVPEDVAADGNIVVIRWSFVRTNRVTGEICKTCGFTFDIVRDGLFVEGWEIGSDKPWV
jgi:hypothetical protein